MFGHQRGFADEVGLVHVHKTVQRGLKWRVAAFQVALPATVALVHAQAVHGIQAKVADIVGCACSPDGGVQGGQLGYRRMQLPAQFAYIVDAHGQAAARYGFDVLRRQPRETGIGQIRLGDLAEHIARTGPGND